MNKEINVPQEIKSWNWGAFLLCPLWCLRHGLWQWVLLFFPLFNIIVPFWMGAKGNEKAWLKNPDEPVESFLKRQKFWTRAGFATWIIGSLVMLGNLFYTLNCSDGMQMPLNAANCSKELVEHFGSSVKKDF